MILPCFRKELLQFPCGSVALDLRIPFGPIMLQQPIAQLGQFAGRKRPDLLLNRLNLSHDDHPEQILRQKNSTKNESLQLDSQALPDQRDTRYENIRELTI